MEWLSLLLGAGGAGAITAALSGIKMLKEQASKRTERAIEQMEKWKNDAVLDAEWYQDLADYWRSRAGDVEYAARSATALPVIIPDPKPMPVRPPQQRMQEA